LAEKGYVQADRMPVLLDGAEWDLWNRSQSAGSSRHCLDCHGHHGQTGSGVSLEERRANMGLWLGVTDREGVLDAEVKLQNVGAGHRVPGGAVERAYAVTVEAFFVDEDAWKSLSYWAGPRLLDVIDGRPEQGGFFLGRHVVDEQGRVASSAESARDVLADSRLEPGRFIESHVLFRRPAEVDWRVVARLYFLPQSPGWRGASLVTQVVVTPEDIGK
jgi:hypothetical protein